jgi:hypothetical protein
MPDAKPYAPNSATGHEGLVRKVDVWLPGKGNSKSHGARPVHQIISLLKWDQQAFNTKLSLWMRASRVNPDP